MKAPSCDRRVNAEERRSLIACRERDGATLYRSTKRMVLDVPRGLRPSPKSLTHGPQGEAVHTNGVAGATLEGVQR